MTILKDLSTTIYKFNIAIYEMGSDPNQLLTVFGPSLPERATTPKEPGRVTKAFVVPMGITSTAARSSRNPMAGGGSVRVVPGERFVSQRTIIQIGRAPSPKSWIFGTSRLCFTLLLASRGVGCFTLRGWMVHPGGRISQSGPFMESSGMCAGSERKKRDTDASGWAIAAAPSGQAGFQSTAR
jgi:hypothetical protein